MGFSATTRWGSDEREPTVERLREILGQLDAEDDEHPSVSLAHESEWAKARPRTPQAVRRGCPTGDFCNPSRVRDSRPRILCSGNE